MSILPPSFSPRRILIIKPSAIGDVVHSLPILARVRKRFPDAKLTWLVTPLCAALVDRHPMVDDIILFNRTRYRHGWYNPMALWDLIKYAMDLRNRNFDLVIDLQGLMRSGLSAWGTGAAVIVGFSNARECAPLFYTNLVDCSRSEHAIDRYLKIADALGCPPGPVEFPFAVDDDDRKFIANLIPSDVPYAVFLPGSAWETKRWPTEKFAALVSPIKQKMGLKTVVAGGPGDSILAQQIGADFDLTGKTDLRQMVALLERARLVIAGDTGPMHIAAALGRPLVSPYGATSPTRTGPFRRLDTVIRVEIPCSPCYSRTCSHQSCMKWLKIEPVLELAEKQMNGELKMENGV
jgi:heptosyltransferase-1